MPYLARHLGGAAAVMEQIYDNRPAGADGLGRAIDRMVHAAPGARAVRHRLIMTAETGRALAPRRLLSVPCGGARDAALIGAPETVLVDPDPHARALAQQACPAATVVAGTLEDLPRGPFDVILFVGLSEYLDERTLVAGLTRLRERLAPGGALLTTTTAENPDRQRMKRLLGWETRARSPDELARLLGLGGLRVEAKRSDPMEIQWLFVARAAVQELAPEA
ncbi:MAG: class I SAM-dependent methyltransferase [bacterium]